MVGALFYALCLVTQSSLAPAVKHQLHVINRCEAWFRRDTPDGPGLTGAGAPIPDEVRRLASPKPCAS